MDEPKWMQIARGELGVREIPGVAAEARIVKYHAATTLKATSDEIPWCSAFANWVMKQAGYPVLGLANARSWLKWGHAIEKPQPGCIVVFRRGGSPTAGHVAFFVVDDGNGYLRVLGGNQSDSVRISRYPAADVLGYRWPNEVEGV